MLRKFLNGLGSDFKSSQIDLSQEMEEQKLPVSSSIEQQLKDSINFKKHGGKTALHVAVRKANQALVESLLKFPETEVNARDDKGHTPLHDAVLSGNVEIAKLLLSNKHETIDINAFNCSNETALHIAVINYHIELTLLLLACGANINAKVKNGSTALEAIVYRACGEQGETIILELLKIYQTKQIEHPSITHLAAFNKNLSIDAFTKILVDAAPKFEERKRLINALDEDNASLLFYAVSNNDEDKVNYLLQNGADANIGKSCILKAVQNSNFKLAIQLHRHGAKWSQEAAELAIKKSLLNNKIDDLKELIFLGLNPNVQVSPGRQSFKSSFSSSLSFNDGRDNTGLLKSGDTPLHYAIRTGDKALATACIHVAPEMVNVANSKGQTPAHLAVKYLDPSMAHLLWEHGEKICVSTKYQSFSNTAKTFLGGEARQNTLLMQAAKRGIGSFAELEKFFQEPHYELSATQKEIKEKLNQAAVKISSMSVFAKQKVVADDVVLEKTVAESNVMPILK